MIWNIVERESLIYISHLAMIMVQLYMTGSVMMNSQL